MNVQIKRLVINTRQTAEVVDFSPTVTFIHGPVGTGKSTVARLIDYCLGGTMEQTPAIQSEFVAATLAIELGIHDCQLERGATDRSTVRVSWTSDDGSFESVNAPLRAGEIPLVGDDVHNLSDLLFFLCGVSPMKVRKRRRDPDSAMVRLSFRDVWWYCYLDQTELDSSFFRLRQPHLERKSQDVMRFFTGLHSEALSQLETRIFRAIDEQMGKREAARQIRSFMVRFGLGSEVELESEIEQTERQLDNAEEVRAELERQRGIELHPTDALRDELRVLGRQIDDLQAAIDDNGETIEEQRALRAELITAKVKARRAEKARGLLDLVAYRRCPKCGADTTEGDVSTDRCTLCKRLTDPRGHTIGAEGEAVRRDLNERIDQIADSIERRERAIEQLSRRWESLRARKAEMDGRLQRDVERYDSPFVEQMREREAEIATLVERRRFLKKLQEMPQAIDALENEAAVLQGKIENLRSRVETERARLRAADKRVAAIAAHFKAIMRRVEFPGVAENDEVVVNPQNWRPAVRHGLREWSFWDAGSGGKKTLFNVCYALAIQAARVEHGMPVPSVLIIDSPTKNISEDENPEVVGALYREIYRFAASRVAERTQLLLIDSDLVRPGEDVLHFAERNMAGRPDAPSLIPYYEGP